VLLVPRVLFTVDFATRHSVCEKPAPIIRQRLGSRNRNQRAASSRRFIWKLAVKTVYVHKIFDAIQIQPYFLSAKFMWMITLAASNGKGLMHRPQWYSRGATRGNAVWRPSVSPSVCLTSMWRAVSFFLTLLGRAAYTKRESSGANTRRGQRTFPSEY